MTAAEHSVASKEYVAFPLTTQFSHSFPFSFDDFQVQACRSVESGKGVLVAVPTGAGKTVVGEFAAFLALHRGKKCFYTTPIKALSNQKYREFVARFGEERVGLLTGDTSINGEADILVMTTEVLRNMLYAGSHTLASLGFVVMDEVHYLADKFRGAVWEEVLIHLMESVQVVSLSATVSNAEEFGEWLQVIRGDTDVIVSETRPVPLYQHLLIGSSLVDLFVEDGRVNPEILRREREAMRRVRTPRHRQGRWSDESHRLTRAEIVELLKRENLLPAITFIFSRVGCDSAVRQCLLAGIRLTSSDERAEIRATALRYTKNLMEEDLEILGFQEWLGALERGLAAHHAGLLPSFKACVEDLFQRGLVKAVFATETLALGINMPARTVVLEKLVKWNGQEHLPITPGEYTQLTGRAGRRGIDIEGNAVVQWSPIVDSATAAGLASTRTYPLRSSFSPTYNMSINLISRFGRARAHGSLESSFAQFQADRAVVGLTRQMRKNEKAIAEFDASAERHLGSDREAHALIAQRADRLRRENIGLGARVESRTHVIAKTFDRICDVLTELGYIEGERTLPEGQILAKIYTESDLLLTEAIRAGIFENLSASELLSVLSSMIFEARTQETLAPRIPSGNVQAALIEVTRLWATLEALEKSHQVATQREPDFGFCWISFRWANGHSLQNVLRGSDLSVGDFVRSIKQLIDLLGQIAEASESLRAKCRDGMKRIDRGVVAYLAGDL